jgi:hypothetical protein
MSFDEMTDYVDFWTLAFDAIEVVVELADFIVLH